MRLAIAEIAENIRLVLGGLDMPAPDFSTVPARPGFGDITCNVSFLLSGKLKKPPAQIADMLASGYARMPRKFVLDVRAHPSGYLNFTVNLPSLAESVVRSSACDNYGFVNLGRSARTTIEHTSVNPNKALHIGHVRNIIIGDVMSRILGMAGYNVTVLNYIDDSGLQVADIILGFKELGFSTEPPDGTKFDHYCGDHVYAKTTAAYETRPQLKQIRDSILQEMEDESSETSGFADAITGRVLQAQLETCWRLGVTYDCLNYESQIMRSGLWQSVFERMKSADIIHLEESGKNAGCWVIRTPGEDDKVIVRSNGTATYIAKDIPYAAWKLGLIDDPFYYSKYAVQSGGRILWKTTLDNTGIRRDLAADRVITIIDSRQSRLQRIITSLMAEFKSSRNAYVHLGYESVTLSPQTARTLGIRSDARQVQMSGRKGMYVNADTVYDMLVQKAADETRRRNPEMPEPEILGVARTVATGAMRYEMIKQDLDKMISFDLRTSLSLEGDTASYIQYAYARASRIMEKAGMGPDLDADYTLLCPGHEGDLVKIIGMFEGAVHDAARNLSPRVMARYCRDLAVTFNSFYEHVRVVDPDNPDLTAVRMCLVHSFRSTLRRSLSLLGITAPDRM